MLFFYKLLFVNFQNFHVSDSATKPWACILGLYVICSVLDGSLTEFVFFLLYNF